jgi:hypothetical protein
VSDTNDLRARYAKAIQDVFPGDWHDSDDPTECDPCLRRAHAVISVRDEEMERLRAELDQTFASNTAAIVALDVYVDALKQAEAERDALKASIAEAVKLINEWMTPGAPLFDPGHAQQVMALLRKTIGARTITALTTPETPEAGKDPR